MKKVLAGSLLALVVAALGWWWFHRGDAGAATAATDAAGSPGAAVDARTLFAAAAPIARGGATLKGRVVGPGGPVAGATVLALEGEGPELLSARIGDCEGKGSQKFLEDPCSDNTQEIVDHVVAHVGEPALLARTTSADDGTFTLEGLPDAELALWAEAPGVGMAVKGDVRPTDQVELRLEAGIVIAGTISGDDQDHPLPGAWVAAIPLVSSRFFISSAGDGGTYRIGPLPRSEYVLVATMPGFLPGQSTYFPGPRARADILLVSPRVIAGRVTNEGKPLAGADVLLESGPTDAKTTSAADGTFHFGALRPANYQVRAQHPLGVASADVNLEPKEDCTDLTLEIGPAGRLVVDIVDERGGPIAGATVYAVVHDAALSGKTDLAGHCDFGLVPCGDYSVGAWREGYLDPPENTEGTISVGALSHPRIALERGTTITGRVLDPDGKPVFQAKVQLDPDADRRPSRSSMASHAATAARDGTFALMGLERGEWPLLTTHDAWVQKHQTVRAPSTGVEIRLERGLTLRGVVRTPGGAGVAEVRIETMVDEKRSFYSVSRASERSKTAVSSADGTFSIEGLSPNRYVVDATLLTVDDAALHATGRVDLRTEGPPLELVLSEGLSITGTVVAADGKPVAEVMVLAIPMGGADPATRVVEVAEVAAKPTSSNTTTDAEGRFVLKHLVAGKYKLSTYPEDDSTKKVVAAGATGVQLRVPRPRLVKGRVLSGRGTPVTSFVVDHQPLLAEDGKFAVPVSSRSTVTIWAKDLAPVQRAVPAGEADVQLGDVLLGGGRTVEFQVVDAATGAPLADAAVEGPTSSYTGDDASSASTRTRPDGRLTLTHQPDEAFTLEVSHDDYRTLTVDVPLGKVSVRVELQRGLTVHGRIATSKGLPVEGMVVALTRMPAEDYTHVFSKPSATDGTYEVTGAVPGRWRTSVGSRATPAPWVWPTFVTLQDGKPATVDFVALDGPCTLRLQVMSAAGKEVLARAAVLQGSVELPRGIIEWRNVSATGLEWADYRSAPVYEGLFPGHYTALIMVPTGPMSTYGTARVEFDLISGDQTVPVNLPATLPELPNASAPAP